MKLTTYVLNLLKDKERKEYMQYVLSDYPNLDIQYVNAINGKNLSLDEICLLYTSPSPRDCS